MSRNRVFLGILLTALFLLQPVSAAVPLAKNTLYICEFKNNGNLYQVNSATAATKLVGSSQIGQACTDLAFNGPTLFGTTFSNLLSINPTTGKATLKGSYGGGINDINALVVQPTSRRLYGAGFRAPGRFVEINPTTGAATTRGAYGSGLGSAGDLAFFNGVLYATLTSTAQPGKTLLARISLSSGSVGKATVIGAIRRVVGTSSVYLRDVYGLSVKSGVLYGALRTGELIRINAANAVATLIGDNNKTVGGMSTSPP